jgi:RimJ/RimL family protein N-acetyltransferase
VAVLNTGNERLILEPLRPGHADEMVVVLGDERLHAHIGGKPDDLDALRARYERMVKGPDPALGQRWLNWIIRLRAEGQAVGTVQATVIPGDEALLARVVGVPWQGRGIASEAAAIMSEWLTAQGVADLAARIHPANAASNAVARRLGLCPTGEIVDGEVVWRNR